MSGRDDGLKRSDLIALLKVCRDFTDTGEWKGTFTYPNCGFDLVRMGLATETKQITPGGRVALYLLGEGDDPTPDSASFVSFTIPLAERSKP